MLLRSAALACAVLLACAVPLVCTSARAATPNELADKQVRITWEQTVKRLVFDKKYQIPPECLSSFCSSELVAYGFYVTPDGDMTTPVLLKSSKDDLVDQQALIIVKKLGPFPRLDPENSNATPLRISIELGFGTDTLIKKAPGDEGMPTFDDLRSRQPLPTNLPPPINPLTHR